MNVRRPGRRPPRSWRHDQPEGINVDRAGWAGTERRDRFRYALVHRPERTPHDPTISTADNADPATAKNPHNRRGWYTKRMRWSPGGSVTAR